MFKHRNGREVSGDTESLEDHIYRPRIVEEHAKLRNANPFITIPLTLLGYLLVGLGIWFLVKHAKASVQDIPKTITIDLQDQGLGEAPPSAPQPAPPAPSGGGPPPGALEKPEIQAPRIPITPNEVPEKPPTELPTRDLSGVAVPANPGGGPNGNGTGTGPGSSEGQGTGTGNGSPGSGHGPLVMHYESSPVREKYRPPEPPYPPFAKMARIQGTVTIEITVGVDGVPVSAHATDGPMQLRKAAEEYAMKWRFEPVTENGMPVIGTWLLKVSFQLK